MSQPIKIKKNLTPSIISKQKVKSDDKVGLKNSYPGKLHDLEIVFFLLYLFSIINIDWVNLQLGFTIRSLVQMPEILRFSFVNVIANIGYAITVVHLLFLLNEKQSIDGAKTEDQLETKKLLYQWIRHPIYLGQILWGLGLSFRAFHPIFCGMYIVWLYLVNKLATEEEIYYLNLSNKYRVYYQSTGKYLPQLVEKAL